MVNLLRGSYTNIVTILSLSNDACDFEMKLFNLLNIKTMRAKILLITGAALAIAAVSCTETILPVTTSDATSAKNLSTRSSALVSEFNHNPLYNIGDQGLDLIGSVPVAAIELNLSLTVPAKGTYTGVSIRSLKGIALSGTFSVADNGYATPCAGNDKIQFAEFVSADGKKSHDLGANQTLNLTVYLPGADYAAGDLVVRLHATGSKTYDAPITKAISLGATNNVSLSFSSKQGNNWATILPDNTYVSQLSIPGTHDAATGDGTTFSLGKTQGLTLDEQWDMGIRAFDLRPGYKRVRTGWFKYENKLHIYHGIVSTNTSFEDAIKTLSDKLAANPGEFAVVVMRFENDSPFYNDRNVWNNLMSKFLVSSSFPASRRVDFKPDLTLGEIRGKILVLSRDAYADSPATGAFVSGWSHGENGSTSGRITGKGGTATLNIQDYYDVSDSNIKISTIKSFADKAALNTTASVWTINHTSGYIGSGVDSGYKNNASKSNAALYDYLCGDEKPAGPSGIIVMDHVGYRKTGSYTVYGDLLPQAIIDNNYRTLPMGK